MRRIRPIYGAAAAIACGHPAATAAGWESLAAGGSVADAAIAAAAVLAVALPHACTLGGDAFMLYHDAKSGQTSGLNASGRSPIATDTVSLEPAALERGPRSCTTTGVIGGWKALHSRFGKLPWAQVLARSFAMAENGFPASPGLAEATVAYRMMLEQDPGASRLFLQDGPLVEGVLFRQPALAATLRAIAMNGADGFYRGPAASTISRYVQSRGGWLCEDDFSGYAPE